VRAGLDFRFLGGPLACSSTKEPPSAMYAEAIRFEELDDLRRYVQERICDEHELEADVFRITERMLTRRGKPCGIFFCLHGPRSVKFTAIWETDRNTILFYGSTGERLHKIKLAASPVLQH
jgi:hypothetical protein